MNGKSLAEWLELKGALSPQQAFSWLEPAVRQLAREHEEGRVHGSISPEAVMVYTDRGLNALSQTYHELYRDGI